MTAVRRIAVLDELRGFAALYVACAHVLIHNLGLKSGWAKLPWVFGQEAVMLFFLLSGAAIRLSVASRGDGGAWTFLQRRFLRLFPMVVLGLAAGYVAAALANLAWPPLRGFELLGNLCFLQDFSPVKPGTICSTYYGNAMLWSLSYEWWFYVLFFVLWRKIPAGSRTHAAGLISLAGIAGLMGWPNAPCYWAAYFILWWAGGTLVDPDPRERWRALGWMVATLAGMGLVAAKATLMDRASWRAGLYPALLVRHVGMTTIMFGALVVAGPWLLGAASRGLRGFAWAAPISYALYVVHYPLASDARWLGHLGLAPGMVSALIYGGCALAAAWLAEKYFQPWAKVQLQRIPWLRAFR